MLAGAFDLHVHAGPDVRARKMSALELARAARQAGMRGLLLKNHHTATTALATTLREAILGLQVFGGLALNRAVGGLNSHAVEAALAMGAAEIWMPTVSAEQECAWRGRPGSGITVLDAQGRLRPEVEDILRLIAPSNAILGTGHISPAEIRGLLRAGREAGVRKFLITHPEIRFLNLPASFQREIGGPGVYFERCYVREDFALDWDGFAEVIREVGVESTVLSTDLGQPENPDPASGLDRMWRELSQRGFRAREIDRMSCRNPATLLGLDP
jgi:hypothetical protein